ncbi:PREDICTED: uncharacterized protein LOC108759166 [Trachymyrmex cornetzi]|uniref:uncharacterized protein LOC108759166 n=1 Tax=Trachymyrmex cornetzi TaxID=471704 RepID=UPI00084F7C7C|nr:PREDICTED: uncharacterized protein LOC108759166 [Trachymyrmex cornetzi]
MTIDQLQVVAQGYNLPLCEDSKKLIDSIMTYLERKPQATQGIITGSPSNGTLPGPSSAKQQSSGVTTIQTWQVSSDVASLIATVVNPMHQDILEGQKRQQELLSKMLELLSNHHGTLANESSEGQPMQPMQEAVSPDGRGIPPSSQRTTLGTITSAHAVTLLATQIPTFGGSDSENVQLWVQRVEQVARIHDVQSDVTLLAASSRLTKLAKRWYDIGSGSMLESWSGFKEAILKRFTRKILYHVAMQKIEVRKWNSFKETFLEYAMDKLTLMHDLNLSPYSIIHLLISGINSRSLRETAAALDLKSVDSFLDSMHKITSVTLEPEKRLTTDSKAAKVKKPTYRRGGKPAHPVSTSQKDKPNTCGFCRIPGHTFENCYKRRRQERLQTTAKASPTTPSTTSSTTTVSAVETVRDDQTIAHVQPKNDVELEVNLHVLAEDNLATDLILGRDFLEKHGLTVVYRPVGKTADGAVAPPRAFPKSLQQILACAEINDNSNRYSEIVTHFNKEVTAQLTSLLMEIYNKHVDRIDDDYKVTVKLKDASVFAYAPRRFAYQEKLQIREITNDLLARGIIKKSNSLYCARVVPVRKKDGRMRLCVDLRSLNQRVIKQKYPFPITEDCIALLGNKRVFTLLDLRDGFHQIKVDEQSTQYFSFATPDGQFEYNRLPFGFCESPAEFQKRLINIFQPLIEDNRVIIYIDDIMIATETVEANLNILKHGLLTLKAYSFELNLDKCKFLRHKVEYLGYTISHNAITISPRHTEAIGQFPRPRSVLKIQRFLGLANYFRKFIRDFSSKTKPLRELLRKSSVFDFSDNCINAFESIKRELISSPVLALYNPSAETQLHTMPVSEGWVEFYYKSSHPETGSRWHISVSLPTSRRNGITVSS